MSNKRGSDMDTVNVAPDRENNEDTTSIGSQSEVNPLSRKHSDMIWFCQKMVSRPVLVFGKYNGD